MSPCKLLRYVLCIYLIVNYCVMSCVYVCTIVHVLSHCKLILFINMYLCILLRWRLANIFVYVYVIIFFSLAEGVTAMLEVQTHHVNK